MPNTIPILNSFDMNLKSGASGSTCEYFLDTGRFPNLEVRGFRFNIANDIPDTAGLEP